MEKLASVEHLLITYWGLVGNRSMPCIGIVWALFSLSPTYHQADWRAFCKDDMEGLVSIRSKLALKLAKWWTSFSIEGLYTAF